MNESSLTWPRLAISISLLVMALGVYAWFDKPECVENSVGGASSSRHVALVVDRSGSMEYLVQEVIDNVNAVLDSLLPTDRVSILFFEDPFGVVRHVENQAVSDVRRLTVRDYSPVGLTPLYDAVGVALADVVGPTIGAGNSSQFGVVVVLSDGEENSSVQYSLSSARRVVAEAVSRGIEIRFYGMGPAAASEATLLGIPLSGTIQIDQTAAGLDEAFDDLQNSLGQATTSNKC